MEILAKSYDDQSKAYLCVDDPLYIRHYKDKPDFDGIIDPVILTEDDYPTVNPPPQLLCSGVVELPIGRFTDPRDEHHGSMSMGILLGKPTTNNWATGYTGYLSLLKVQSM